MSEADTGGLSSHLDALRHANDGFAITIWADAGDGQPGWRLWRTLDAKYAEADPGWLMTISGEDVMEHVGLLAATGHQMRAFHPR